MSAPTIVFVTGDREWTDDALIAAELRVHLPGTWLLNGGCRGADLLAQSVAYDLGFQPIRMDAIWSFHGTKAGPIRNRQMGRLLDLLRGQGVSVYAYAFHDNLAASKGTKDMTTVLDGLGIAWKHVHHAAAPDREEAR